MATRPLANRSQTPSNARQWTDAAVALRWAKKAEADARTRKLELEFAEASGQVWREADLRPYFARVWSSLRVQLMELPEALAERLNPTDPAAASAILEEALRRLLDSVCAQLDAYQPAAPKSGAMDAPD